MKFILLFLFILLGFGSFTQAQSNPCGVVAAMTPAGDSIIQAPNTLILFENASTNATSYKFVVNGFINYVDQPLPLTIETGLTEISLIAFNGSCSDTVTYYYFYAGQYPSNTDNYAMSYGFETRYHLYSQIANYSTGGYLLSGIREPSSTLNESDLGFVIKTRQEGCIDWALYIKPLLYSSKIFGVCESADGQIYARGESILESNTITKISSAGSHLWTKGINRPDGSRLLLFNVAPMPDGGLLAVGSRQIDIMHHTVYLLRLDRDGNIVWQRELNEDFSYASGFKNVVYKDGYLYVGGDLSILGNTQVSAGLAKLNYGTGDLVWFNKYQSTDGGLHIWDLKEMDSVLVLNVTGTVSVPGYIAMGGLMRVDTSGAVQQTYLYAGPDLPSTLGLPYSINQSRLVLSGGYFHILTYGTNTLFLQPGIAFTSRLLQINKDYQALRNINYGGVGAERFYDLVPQSNGGVTMGGMGVKNGLSTIYSTRRLLLKNIDSSGGNPNAGCYRIMEDIVGVPVSVNQTPLALTIDQPGDCLMADIDFSLIPFYPTMRFVCPDYVDSCSYLEITGQRSICNLNGIYEYKVHKNRGCGQPTNWVLPAGANLVSQTDSTISVRFNSFGRHVIYGRNVQTCIPVEDSIVVIAESRTPPLDLGPTAELCPQNTLTLHAGNKFFSYLWYNGSTDSTVQIDQPGLYWVEVMDSCNNVLRDTITVIAAPPIPLTIGPDLQKCNQETLDLQAPPGFLNYSWGPDYNISSLSGALVTVQPEVDTSYMVRAEKTPGCFAFDTVFIKVYHSPPIDLGPDLRFCQGDSALLDAGQGFQTYQWNTGEQTQAFYVFNQGAYSVEATTAEGCKSSDEIIISPPYSLPTPQLDQNNVLCEGTFRTLDPGPGYNSYLWNSGSANRTLIVSDRGVYQVEVTDANGCKGTASTTIDLIQPVPARFLIEDTAICAYGRLELRPLRSFNSYLWSNGSSQSQISISSPGTYWLEVTDLENCLGRDSVVVLPKECMKGLYVPSAFTPNADGKNDLFRPLLFGQIAQFEFLIYNRWGQVVFRSTNPGEGWDGKLSGLDQDTNVFVWLCKYRLQGEQEQTARGTVTLIR